MVAQGLQDMGVLISEPRTSHGACPSEFDPDIMLAFHSSIHCGSAHVERACHVVGLAPGV